MTQEIAASSQGQYWWRKDLDSKSVHVELTGHAKWLETVYHRQAIIDRIHERIYRGSPTLRTAHAALQHLAMVGRDMARLNVTKSIVDTAVAKLGKRRPMPMVVVDDADWSFKRRGRQFSRFIKAKLRETDFDEESPAALRMACVRGTGIIKVTEAFGEIAPECVRRDEILVDPREAKYGKPRQLVHRKRYTREVLAEMFPEHRAQIASAPAATRRLGQEPDDEFEASAGSLDNLVDVYEAWHLPSGPEGKDGRHAIVVEGATLQYREWNRKRFPMAFIHWTKPLSGSGFWGTGIVEDVADLQHRINCIIRDIQRNIEYAGNLIVFTRRGSNVPTEQLTGRKPFRIEYDGTQPPIYQVPQAVSQGQLATLDKLERAMYDLTGVSMMSAQGRNPLGANASGVALDNFYDIETERFSMQENDYARFRLRCGQLYVDAAYDLAERLKGEKKRYSAVWVDKIAVQRIDWTDVAMEREQFELELEPINFLPDTRAGKLRAVSDLAQAGVIQQRYVGTLFDEPDIERINRLQNAQFNNLERVMEQLGDESKPMVNPHPFMDLALAKDLALASLSRDEANGAPDVVLQRYMEFLDLLMHLEKEVKSAQTPSPPPTPDPQMQPDPGMSPEMVAGTPPAPQIPPAPPAGAPM
jgi:hypothetical protein